MKKLISIITHTYNEEGNVHELYRRVVAVIEKLPAYEFEIIYIDNQSADSTVARIVEQCACDSRVRLIVNARNFGHLRSPYHALMQAQGEAVISLASDLQDPPELIPELIKAWEEGYSVAAGVYRQAPESRLLKLARSFYYRVIQTVSESDAIQGFTGFGLYDRRVLELMRRVGGPYPYVRGLVSQLGLPIKLLAFDKLRRTAGITKNNLLTLVDLAILGLTNMSRAPVRFATLLGAAMSLFGFGVALIYLIAKLLFWDSFAMGQAPLLIGIFLFGSVQVLIAGLIGEYVASLHQRSQNHPHVVELYRMNFPDADIRQDDPAIGPSRKPAECKPPQAY